MLLVKMSNSHPKNKNLYFWADHVSNIIQEMIVLEDMMKKLVTIYWCAEFIAQKMVAMVETSL